MLSPQRGGSKLVAMRRATFVLASVLTAAVVAALLYDRDWLSPTTAARLDARTDQRSRSSIPARAPYQCADASSAQRADGGALALVVG